MKYEVFTNTIKIIKRMNKKSIFLSVILFVLAFTINAQNDTLYVMKNGAIVGQYNVNTEVDSIIFYQPVIEEATSGTFTDERDNKVYNWVKIGDQVWMAENLAFLPNIVHNNSEFQTAGFNGQQPGYGVYEYDGNDVLTAKTTVNYQTYGVLYNWYAAMAGSETSTANPSGVQGVCPTGWHLPSDAEWTELTNYLGGTSDAGGKLKAKMHWNAPNTGASNETGFIALPGGFRYFDGSFLSIGNYGHWWSATESSTNSSWRRYMTYDNSSVYKRSNYKEVGFSIRCVRD